MARIARKTKRIVCILVCCVLVMAHMGTSRKFRAEALPDVASGSTTIADIVLTYYSTVGAGISNVEFINTLSQDLGTNFGTIESFAEQGMLLQNETTGAWEPVSELVTAIENTSAYQSLGLDQIFNVSAQEAAAGGGLAASGAATLAGAAGGVASIGMLPLFAGVTASYWAGIGIGTLINHLTGAYEKPITNGNSITFAEAMKDIPAGNGSVFVNSIKTSSTRYVYYSSGRLYLCFYGDTGSDGYRSAKICSFDNGVDSGKVTFYRKNLNGSSSTNSFNSTKGVCEGPSAGVYINAYTYGPSMSFSDITALRQFLSDYEKGNASLPQIYSPDVIGENGNQVGSYDSESQKYNVPGFKPQIDPGTEAAKPISVQDWLNFANSVHNNNSQVDPLPYNARLFQDLIDTMRIGLPSPGPSPDPDPDPDPDPYPDPNPNPDPTPVPDPDYGDPNPDQPESTDSTEDSTEVPDPVDTGIPWRLPDLSKKFPFCIPWDIGKMFGKLKVNAREAPHISWRFNPPGIPVDYTFNLDLEDYENVASLLRSLELIAFIIGLAFATRYLIGAT